MINYEKLKKLHEMTARVKGCLLSMEMHVQNKISFEFTFVRNQDDHSLLCGATIDDAIDLLETLTRDLPCQHETGSINPTMLAKDLICIKCGTRIYPDIEPLVSQCCAIHAGTDQECERIEDDSATWRGRKMSSFDRKERKELAYSSLDRTFCASPNCKNECGRKMSDFYKNLIAIQAGIIPISYAYFCGEP